ncbi:unnamed protein product [Peronospora belbahrii]|uniref:Uncharacterized protein n=1 Tax=Peronospora belbahrii TaxID=622444 RepID=A0AAU9LAY6_9STRA|nr:unnamed protein product [Peronospora belbahrii]
MRHERAMAPVLVPLEDTTSEHRLPTTYAEVLDSVRQVIPVRAPVSPRRQGRRDRVCPPLSSPSLKPASPFETLIVVNMTVAGPSSHLVQVAKGRDRTIFPVVPNPDLINHEHPEEMEQKSAREEKFAAHFGRSLLRQRILFSRLRASLPMSFLTLPPATSGLGGGEIAKGLADISSVAIRKKVEGFLSTRFDELRRIKDAMAESQDVQKEHADAKGRKNEHEFKVGDLVLLNARNLPTNAVSAVYKTKLRPRFIGPLKVISAKGLA